MFKLSRAKCIPFLHRKFNVSLCLCHCGKHGKRGLCIHTCACLFIYSWSQKTWCKNIMRFCIFICSHFQPTVGGIAFCLSVTCKFIIHQKKIHQEKFITREPLAQLVQLCELPQLSATLVCNLQVCEPVFVSCKSESHWQVCSLQRQVASFKNYLFIRING